MALRQRKVPQEPPVDDDISAQPSAEDLNDGFAPPTGLKVETEGISTQFPSPATAGPSSSASWSWGAPPGSPSRATMLYNQACDTWVKAKKRYHLVDFSAAPQYMRDNEYITRHYRAEWPLKQALLSLFKVHNETLNIWTHLVGFFLFLALTIYTAYHLPKQLPKLPQLPNFSHIYEAFEAHAKQVALPNMGTSTVQRAREMLHTAEEIAAAAQLQALEGARDMMRTAEELSQTAHKVLLERWEASHLAAHGSAVPRWPFFVFLAGAMTCLLSSSMCHLLACQSAAVSKLIWRFDYCGIAVMIGTSFFPPVYYGFMCNPLWRNCYLTAITIIGIGAICVALMPHFQTPKWRTTRAAVFAGMGVSGVFPCVHKLIYYWSVPSAHATTLMEASMGLLYLTGAAIYSARIPERWKPGMFDIVGSSHQIFHMFVIAGAYTHYHCGLHYLHWRDTHPCPDM